MVKKGIVRFFLLAFLLSLPVLSSADNESHGTGFEAGEVKYNLGIFGDVDFTTNSREKRHNSFFLGETDFYGTANYGRMNFLAELLIEFDPEETVLDFERLWIGYTFSDLLVLRAGKHHTSIGYWNRTYHHGKQLFTAIDRPFVIAFEDGGGVIPAHIVGAELEGKFFTEFVNFKYEFQIGNGPGITSENTLNPNNGADDNASKEWILRLSASPTDLSGLTLGISGTSYKISPVASSPISERIIGIDLALVQNGLELLGEFYRMSNPEKDANLFYLQAGYHISSLSLTPYIRYESLSVEDSDPYMNALGGRKDRVQGIAGIRYDLNERSSLKAQFRQDDEDGSDVKNAFEFQWAFHF